MLFGSLNHVFSTNKIHKIKINHSATLYCPQFPRQPPTRMRSESMMVCRRWAIVSTVHERNFSRIVCWISPSVLTQPRHFYTGNRLNFTQRKHIILHRKRACTENKPYFKQITCMHDTCGSPLLETKNKAKPRKKKPLLNATLNHCSKVPSPFYKYEPSDFRLNN